MSLPGRVHRGDCSTINRWGFISRLHCQGRAAAWTEGQPIDITRSDWLCTIEGGLGDLEIGNKSSRQNGSLVHESRMAYTSQSSTFLHPATPAMRLGLLYVRGLREESARAIVRERATRPFADIDDLHNRVPELRKDELRKLAAVGALNFLKEQVTGDREQVTGSPLSPVTSHLSPLRQSAIANRQSLHRRSALWQVERVARPVGPLLKTQKEVIGDRGEVTGETPLSPVTCNLSPLRPMTIEERVNADFRGTGLTIGRHPMAYRREELNKLGVKRAIDLREIRNGVWVRVAGWIIVRQRPGTAKGFLFLSMEDETGIANVIVTPDIFDRNRAVLVNQPLLLIDGPLQNQDGVIHVRARRIQPLPYAMAAAASHDFH